MKYFIIILSVLFQLAARAQVSDTTIFLQSEFTFPEMPVYLYPQANFCPFFAMNVLTFKNVENYGAIGNDANNDDAAITAAFNAANLAGTGVYFPPKLYQVSKLTIINLTKRIGVYALGATIKMADNKRYSALNLVCADTGYSGGVVWYGGTLDGNRNNQSYPGSPAGQSFVEDHGRFVGVEHGYIAAFYRVDCKDIVMDGIGLESDYTGVFANCTANNSARFEYRYVQDQGTAFKFTRIGLKNCYAYGCTVNGGSIGIQVSYPENAPSIDSTTTAVIQNCSIKNCVQNPLHFEDCSNVFITRCNIENDTDVTQSSCHFSNKTIKAIVTYSSFRNIRLNYNNAASMKLNITDSCHFKSENVNDSVETFIYSGMFVTRCDFTGRVRDQQCKASYVLKSSFIRNSNVPSVLGAKIADYNTFSDLASFSTKPVSFAGGGKSYHSTFNNVSNVNTDSSPLANYDDVFKTFIEFRDYQNRFIGRQTAGK